MTTTTENNKVAETTEKKVAKKSAKKGGKKVRRKVVVIDTRETDDPRGRTPKVSSFRQKRLRHFEAMEKAGLPIRRGRYSKEMKEKIKTLDKKVQGAGSQKK